MKIFISGGAKNGKSTFAQNKAVTMSAGVRPLYYVATMIPTDDEDRLRIRRHVENREGLGFVTVERGTEISGILDSCDPEGVFLLDSVTALLANNMFLPGGYDAGAGEKTARDLERFCGRVLNAVFVSDYIYSDARRFDEMTENYRRSLALVDRRLAEACDEVYEVICGVPLRRKPGQCPAHQTAPGDAGE